MQLGGAGGIGTARIHTNARHVRIALRTAKTLANSGLLDAITTTERGRHARRQRRCSSRHRATKADVQPAKLDVHATPLKREALNGKERIGKHGGRSRPCGEDRLSSQCEATR